MSRSRRRNLDRGISQPLVERTQRVRRERHGKPVTVRRRLVVEDPLTGLLEIKHVQVPVTEPRTVRVAAGPTGKHGRLQTSGSGKDNKSEAPAWWKGAR